jgi:hypothetical protein
MPETCRHCQLPGHPSAKCPGIPTHPAAQPAEAETRLAIVDGRDALAAVIIRPANDGTDRITVDANARGMSKAVAAYALRQTADQFDAAALAEGDEPITAEEAGAEQQRAAVEEPAAPLTATAALYEAMRRIADAPQDYELDPGRGDARATLRALLAEVEGKAQPAAVEERRAAECAHVWVTALDGDDRPARDRAGNTWQHCGICGQRKAEDGAPTRQHRAEVETLRARVAELEKRIETALADHTPFDDSRHCQHDGEPWPCPTVTTLASEA